MVNVNFKKSIGKTIKEITFDGNSTLHFVFDDDTKIKIYDDGQCCCEERYMTTDDDLEYFVGSKFVGLEIKTGPPIVKKDCTDLHEIEFLEIQTDIGCFTMANHNIHNGWYSGFAIAIESE